MLFPHKQSSPSPKITEALTTTTVWNETGALGLGCCRLILFMCVCACVFVYMRHTLKNKQASTKAQQDADKFKHIPTEHV